jgi:hypothetical protein
MKKEPDDRNKLKIASFRTTDGDWFDFSQAAESNGLTATDVLKACMVEYLQGTYTPVINTPVSMRLQAAQGVTADEVQALISTAISTAPVNDDLRAEVDHLRECLAKMATTDYVERALEPVMLAIDTQSQDLAAVRSDCDVTTEGIQRLIADALGKVSIATTTTAIKTASIANGDGRIEFRKFADDHGLTIKRGDSADIVNKALKKAGLTGRYRYNSTIKAFFEVNTDG